MEGKGIEKLVRQRECELLVIVRHLVKSIVPMQFPPMCFSKERELRLLR